MSDTDNPSPKDALAEPVALKESVREGASDADVRLCRALGELYPDALPPADPAAWARVERAATGMARARRRRRLLRDLWSSLGSWRVAVAGAGAMAVLVVGWLAIHTEHRVYPLVAESDPFLIATPRARIAGTSPRPATLLGGAEIAVTGTADVDQMDPAHTRIALRAGRVAVQVPHLPPTGTFAVETDEAEIVVHGTRFMVDRDPPGHTTVRVDEGVVEVRPRGGRRSPLFLRPSERVVVPSLDLYFAELEHRLDDLLSAADCQGADAIIAPYLDAAPTGRDVSAAVYLRGFCAAQRGDEKKAIADFDQVAAAAGDSTRRDNAAARAARLRGGKDPMAGCAAWRGYLERFPDGIHRGLALHQLAACGGRR